MFLAVGEAIEGVSSLSPVVLFPKVEGREDVLRESLGRLVEAVGRETGVCEGSMLSDIVSTGMSASITRALMIIY